MERMRREKRKKPNRISLRMFLSVISLFVVAAYALVTISYIRQFDRTLMEENRSHLAEVADHIVSYTHTVIRDMTDSLVTAAGAVAAIREENVLAYLGDVAGRQGFIYAGYAWADGVLHATEPTQNGDVSGEEWFQAALAGRSTATGLERRVLTDRVASGVLLAVPLRNARGKTVGALAAMLDRSRLGDALGVESFGGEGYSYIIDRDGNLVLYNKSMDYSNFYRLLGNVRFEDGMTLERLREEIGRGQSGMIAYRQLGLSRFAFHCPLGLNDWTVVNIVAKDVVTQKTDRLTRELVAITGVTVVAFILLLASAGISWAHSQSQRHAAQVKSAFLANVSHEIRTPMNAIVGLSEILLRSGLRQDQQECASRICSSGKGLLALINDILDISKIESGRFTIHNEAYDLRPIVEDVTEIAVIRIGDKPVTFLTDIDASVPARMVGDRTRIKQILVNLLGNAAKFTERGSIRLTLRAQEKEGMLCLRIAVEDTGIGIKKQDMDKLFVSFSQIESSSGEGSGLGLAITRALSQLMGGDIEVESVYGKGSIFTSTILQGICASGPLVESLPAEGISLLILEKEEALRESCASCLERMGLRHRLCESAGDFERELELGKYSHALADRETARRLSGREGQTRLGVLLGQWEHFLTDRDGRPAVYAPLFALQLGRLLSPPADEERSGGTFSQYPHARVLIVDDNELNLEIAACLMEPFGLRIDCVLSGREAVEAVRDRTYDLVFMDHMMPDMDGVETLKYIRRLPGGRGASLPVVALTANVTDDARAMFLREGFDAFLPKPIETEQVRAVLERFFGRGGEPRGTAGTKTGEKRKNEPAL